MTVERGQATLPPDPLASQRTELIGQLVASQFAIEAALADLVAAGGDSAVAGELRSQLASLSDLRQQVGSAPATTLAALRSEVTAAAGNASTIVQQARAAAAAAAGQASSTQPMTPQQARQAIQSVGHDLFDRHVLDPSLKFTDAQDEAAYRKREEERRIAYERELEKHTVEGDRNATTIVKSQLADAKAHGADRNPEFASLLSRTEAAASALQPPQRGTAAPARNGTKSNEPSAASIQSSGGNDVDAITAALKATGVVIERAPDEPAHGVPARSRIATSAKPSIGG